MMQIQFRGLRVILEEAVFAGLGGFPIVDKGIDLAVKGKAADIQVGCADDGQVIIGHQGLGMDEGTVSFIELYAGSEALLIVRPVGGADERRIYLPGSITRTSTPLRAALLRASKNPSGGMK